VYCFSVSRRNPTFNLRLRIVAVALLPLLLAVGLFAAYFAHRGVGDAEAALELRGRAVARHLAEAVAMDLFANNLVQVKRMLDYESQARDIDTLAITDGATWQLFSGTARALPALDGRAPAEQWRVDTLMYFSHPVLPSPTTEHDPYLDSLAVPLATNYLVLAMSRAPLERIRAQVILAAGGMASLAIFLALILAWRLSGRISQPLQHISQVVGRLADGQLSERAAEVSPGDIGQLERGVNRMAQALEEHQGSLHARVEAATADLRAQKLAAETAMRAKSRFLAAASHDLRQPLHALTLLVAALKENLTEREPRRITEHIEASAAAMENLLNALLDLSKLDAGVIQVHAGCFPLHHVMRTVAKQFTPLALERHIELRVAPCSLSVFSDPLLLERILSNLVSNALRHTAHGRVLIGARRLSADTLRLEVRDTGKGIPPAFQDRIFEEYFQLDNPERARDKGLGLGLAIVARLCKLLDSEVRVHSRPGQGACFSLHLTRCVPAADQVSALPTGVALSLPLTHRLIAYIDDDEAILEAMVALFEPWGAELAVGVDAEQIRAELRAIGRAPDIILSDYRLRENRTGIDAIQLLRDAFGANIPAALLTGDTASDTIQTIRASGLPVLHKPIKPANLRALLSHLLAGPADDIA